MSADERSPRHHGYAGHALVVVEWDDVREDDTFDCRCGWNGALEDMTPELFHEVAEYDCPTCFRMLVVREYPRA